VQKPYIALGQWLRHSDEAVPVESLKRLMARFQLQEQQQHADTAAMLLTGTMPNLLFSASVNPALLCIMHAYHTHSAKVRGYLPCPCVLPQSNPCTSPTENSDVACLSYARAIGEVWWLFDAERPYLAEVFKKGDVPNNRLPHLDRSTLKGQHIARMLGRNRTLEVDSKASMCLFTPR
jgi:hypothetical protein